MKVMHLLLVVADERGVGDQRGGIDHTVDRHRRQLHTRGLREPHVGRRDLADRVTSTCGSR
jgi:hypothetical protein